MSERRCVICQGDYPKNRFVGKDNRCRECFNLKRKRERQLEALLRRAQAAGTATDDEAWERFEPRSNLCCICAKALGERFVPEIRPTGPSGAEQMWFYCLECWDWKVQGIAGNPMERRRVDLYSLGSYSSGYRIAPDPLCGTFDRWIRLK